MQTKTSSKFALIACLAIGAGIATAVWASSTKSNLTSVKSDLGHSVQTIQEVVFTKDGLRPENDDQAVVRMKIDGKTLIFEGKVLVSREGVDNTLSADTTASTLFAGQRNTVAGNSSAVMAGVDGTIEPTAYGTAVLWGRESTIKADSSFSVISAGNDWFIQWTHSFIAGGQENVLEGDGNVTLGGVNTTVKGAGNFVAGKHIKYNENQDTNGAFVWSDNSTVWSDPSKGGLLFTPQKSDSFYIRAAGGVAIGKATASLPEGVDVAGMVQIADEPHLVCDQHTRGAMKFTESCFCACIQEGSEHRWVNMTPSETCATRCPSSASSAGSSSTAPATSPKLCPPASDLPPRGLNQSISQGSCANGATPSSPQAGTNAWTRNCTLNGKTESCSVACAAGLEIDAHTQVCTPALQPVNASCHPSMQAISAGNTLTTTTAVLCQAGTLKPNSIHADPTTKSRNWICEGIAGGNNQNCNISCATGSVMVLSNGSYSCQTPACTGTLPQSALMYASAGENAPATVLPWQYSASDTPRKCEFRCQDGYNWNGSACVINQYTVTAESNTTAWGSVTPSSKTLAHWAQMTVIATPLAPHKFKHWIDKENNAELSTNPTYNFTVTKNLSLQAIFEETIVLPPVPKGVKWGCQSTANLTCTRQDGVTGAMNACADLNNDSDRFKYCNVSGAFERRKNASSPVRLTTATINQFNCSWHSGSGHQWTTFDNPGCTHEPYEIRWLSDCTTVPERVAVCLWANDEALPDEACTHLGAKPNNSTCIVPPPLHGKCDEVIPGECQVGTPFDDNNQTPCWLPPREWKCRGEHGGLDTRCIMLPNHYACGGNQTSWLFEYAAVYYPNIYHSLYDCPDIVGKGGDACFDHKFYYGDPWDKKVIELDAWDVWRSWWDMVVLGKSVRLRTRPGTVDTIWLDGADGYLRNDRAMPLSDGVYALGRWKINGAIPPYKYIYVKWGKILTGIGEYDGV